MSAAAPHLGYTARRVLALAGIVLVALTLRTAVTSITPLLGEVDAAIGLGSTGKGLVGMVPTAMFALWGVVTPALLRRTGLVPLTVVAMVVSAVGLVVRSVATDPWVLAVGSLLALTGSGIGNVVAPPLVKTYFPDRVAAMSTAYITALQVGTVVPALVAVPVSDAAGWRVSLGWWAALSVVAALPWLGVGRGSDVPETAGAAESIHAAEPAESAPRIRPWASPVGVSIALFFGCNSLCTYAFFTWLPQLAEGLGMSHAAAGASLALFSALGLVAALAVPWLAARMTDPYPVVVAAIACYLVGFAGVLWAPAAAWLWVCLLGVGPSTFPLCLTLINLRTRTAAGSAALSGFAQGVGYTAACLGPVVFGVLLSASGTAAALAFLTVVLAVMAVVARQACRPRMLEDTLDPAR